METTNELYKLKQFNLISHVQFRSQSESLVEFYWIWKDDTWMENYLYCYFEIEGIFSFNQVQVKWFQDYWLDSMIK